MFRTIARIGLLTLLLLGEAIVLSVVYGQNPNTAIYPSAVITDSELPPLINRWEKRLVGSVSNSTTTIVVTDASELLLPIVITIDEGTTRVEDVLVTGIAGNTLTVTRGYDGSTPSPHNNGAKVNGFIVRYHLNQVFAELKAIQTALGANLGNISGGGIGNCNAPTELTISSGSVTINADACYTIDTEGDIPSDDLDTFTCAAGRQFVIRAADDGRTIVIKNSAAIPIRADFELNSQYDTFYGLCVAADTVTAIARKSNGS